MIFEMPFLNTRGDSEEEKEEKEEKKRGGGDLIARLLKTRTIIVTDEVNKKMAERVITQLLLLEADNDEDIRVFINSPGGDADAGFAMYDMLRFVKPKIKAICSGVVASAAVIILLGAKKEDRYSLPSSRILIHQPSTGIHGTASDLQIEATEILKCREKMNRMISVETGQPIGKVETDTKRNFWMSAEEACQYGLVNKIISSSDDLKV
ncbi:ATP-dependent Clp protease proteolytic subunit 3 [Candidatus Kuenenia stuttgartiensis]|jgi:ATP-dependent Clp protease protease subunit|uniref:ATP-dependent Clp protease proteolytic subunit n=1 Tax=Kuenenia stuttgartiensis TaxID=174633 RepID=Q1PYX1_KUEST|nr:MULTISPECIES: ATP-dependent Clp protease proteolytic subunit [Kuenenia]MBE7547443.1 ATP-dependent Clp protease proteolytic subunit [Planctomycetia bacterium]MBZ0190451.1 ATP-dependent Clp protease proteolytic subunit [Candidatus Kuenenia stuttgartiensis]MCF6152894.1 ATP-dependent Clp protease proteolytic subunit [Candidatus Kuenenia stuttgartiensis]MCL4728394.1 ATP-dependent Clp protease proteolytic subunit [Candidatus Kuenenia stuttgartiensis]MCZ7624198.1 ATP-dependent Clp protease proteol